ncbi:hypothetical protein NLJ89_g6712 [Agrocybe chaxingu]|uniref:Sec20 C-terminal domain-containing protein n=1 Tax=Agrocybe chaxingu TaxID=84603 RepID=A0A9W8MSE8_9AGAR|nr:hypothetical protein NLJ89_g6712 [Agrocybe chaxingu]
MPPIPTRLPEETRSRISDAERRYKHLSEVQVPQLRKCTGPLSLQQSLADDLRENTALLAKQIEELDISVDDHPGTRTRAELREIVNGLLEKLESLRQDTRVALLKSKRAIDARSKSNKEELLARSPGLQDRQTSSEKTTEDALMKANSDVTDALRRTIALMQSELERSVLTTQMLDESTSTLRATSLQHDTLSGIMSTSRQLIIALEKSDWLDRVLIISAFVFFLLVVLFIVKQRIVDRSIRIAFWWTKFIPSIGSGSGNTKVLRDAEKGVGGLVSTSVVSVAASLTSSMAVPVASIISSSLSSPSSPVASPEPSSEVLETLSSVAESSPIPVEQPVSASPTKTAIPTLGEPVHVEL